MSGGGGAQVDVPVEPTTPAAFRRERFVFLDALRGFALVFMVLNHTGRWWQDGSMGWPRYYGIYVTMAVAAPIFLFLVGFCLPLSGTRERPVPLLWKYAARGGRLILAGLLLNLLVFPTDPIYSNGVLQTIGFSIVAAATASLLLGHAGARSALLAVAVLAYLLFGWSFPALTRWVDVHPAIARVLFFEFPPWPWLSLVLIGLVLGDLWVGATDRRARAMYMHAMLLAGGACLVAFLGYDAWAHTPNRWMFKRDFILNHHWTPRGASTLWILGMIFVLMPAFYYLAEVRRYRMTWLVTLGRTALVLYFIHQLIVLRLVNEGLGLRFNPWWRYAVANLILMAVLLAIGRGWLEMKRLTRQFAAALPSYRWLFSFDGRLPRSGYWLALLYVAIAAYVLAALLLRTMSATRDRASLAVVLALASIPAILMAWAALAVLAKRWHDRNRSGWMSLILAIPILGQLWVLVDLGCLRGTEGANRYGDDPLRRATGSEAGSELRSLVPVH